MKLLSSKEKLNKALIGIIEQSQNKLIIISPFISFKDNFLNEKIKDKKSILEIYTKLDNKKGKTDEEKEKIEKERKKVLDVLKKLVDNEDNLLLIDHLHAKIYINDKVALLTSMNFNDAAFAKSLDFGIITENKEEYDNVIDFCEKNIFFYSKKKIRDYFSEKSISVKFEIIRNSIAKCDGRVNYLILEKDKNTKIRCHVQKGVSKTHFYLEIIKNGKDYKLENKKYGTYKRGEHVIPLLIDEKNVELYQKEQPLLIPVLNKYKDKTLGILMEVYNCLDE
jgi:phosphatidylserine/phosphatidylglycerophosphate/cardiolipin synthase-like enzyme